MRNVIIAICVACALASNAGPTWGWNERGHKVVAYIAYRTLDPTARARVVALLQRHPEFSDWQARSDGGPNESLNLFLFAAVFADEVRGEAHRFHSLDEPRSHYAGFPYIPRLDDQQDPSIRPVDPSTVHNLLKAYQQKRSQVTDAVLSPSDRAVALSWVFHLVGDVHQPLHNVGRYSATFPEGDRGGNEVLVVNPRGEGKLHAYWDDMLGGQRQDPFENVQRTADELLSDGQLQRDQVPQLHVTDFEAWSQEGFVLAKEVVYQGLDPLDRTPELPADYDSKARQTARRQVALAGYRLAAELQAIFSSN